MATAKASKKAATVTVPPTAGIPVVGKNGPSMAYLKEMAKKLELSGYSRLSKAELIHAIQLAEGHRDCYQRISGCLLPECLFYIPCQQS